MEAILEIIMARITGISPWLIYLLFFVSAVLQITVPPYPGDTLLIFGGYLGSIGIRGGYMPILISYLLGTVISSYALYVLGVKKGKTVLKFKLISKFFSRNHQRRAKKWLFKYGVLIFFICKFIPGLNSLIIIFGGVFRYNPLWAGVGVGLASLIHNILFFLIGRSIGYNLESIKSFLSAYNIVVIVLAAGAAGGIYAYKRNKKAKSNTVQEKAELE